MALCETAAVSFADLRAVRRCTTQQQPGRGADRRTGEPMKGRNPKAARMDSFLDHFKAC